MRVTSASQPGIDLLKSRIAWFFATISLPVNCGVGSSMSEYLIWEIDPQIFSFAPVPRWYGLIFASGIVGGYVLMKRIFINEQKDLDLLDKLLLYVFIGMLL